MHMNITKKRRLVVSVRRSNLWTEILHVWTKISRLPSLVDASNKKCSRFVVFNGTRQETIVDINELESPGSHSEIYEIVLNGHLRTAILKLFCSSNDENVPGVVEAQLQNYAYTHGFAPAVLAFNSTAMISARCQAPVTADELDDNYTWNSVLTQHIDLRTTRKRLSSLNFALGRGAQKILEFSKNMFDKIGMYNMDPNLDNYMMLNESMVQIDFGMNRFCNRDAYEKFAATCQHGDVKRVLDDDGPESPPDYFWFETFVSNGQTDTSEWEVADWASYHMNMPAERTNMIRIIREKRTSLLQDLDKRKTEPTSKTVKFKTYTSRNSWS